ncbi:MAG: hypothetical protein P4L31_02480 [Candidatus Babeliales bacterium]|nr:hypothetical protein [Candidatus Babeliales bacterium]
MFGFVSCSLNASYTQILLSFAALFIAYVMIVCWMGYYRAWIANKMGDSSAADAGFLTLNPRKQVSMQGLFTLLLFRFGWGATQPHRPTTITSTAQVAGDQINQPSPVADHSMWTKLFVAYLSSPLLHVAAAIFDMIILLAIFGKNIVALADTAMLHGNFSHSALWSMYPTHSGITVFIALILIFSIYIHVFSAVFNCLFRGSKIFMIYLAEKSPRFALYHNFAKIFLGVVVVLFFLTPQIRFLLVNFVSYISLLIARLIGVV